MLDLCELTLKTRDLLGERVLVRLATALLRREACELAGVAQSAPLREMRRVQAFATKQFAERPFHT
jgi:hypothetical protein